MTRYDVLMVAAFWIFMWAAALHLSAPAPA